MYTIILIVFIIISYTQKLEKTNISPAIPAVDRQKEDLRTEIPGFQELNQQLSGCMGRNQLPVPVKSRCFRIC